jgi:hypothetical protein
MIVVTETAGWLMCGRLVDLAAPPPPAEPAVDHIR